MASFSNGSQLSILQLVFNATTWNSIAQNNASPATSLYVSLHTADPGEAGSQTTNETTYTNYVRVAVARSNTGFSCSGGSPAVVTNAGAITFAQCGTTGATITHWGIGLASSGAGTLLCSGPVGAGPALEFTGTAASPGVLTVPNGSFTVNQQASVYPTATASLPSGLTEGTVYFIGTISGLNVTLSTSTGNGTPVNTTAAGAGVIIAQTPLIVSTNVTPSFTAGSLIFRQW